MNESNNINMNKSKSIKNDEFYTLIEDIEKEISYYKDQLIGKIVYCNCDDFRKSNFIKYFLNNFKSLGLNKLICTSYNENGNGLYFSYDGITHYNGKLKSNGDFRSHECLKLLEQCDIVITNPPFSLFKEYINILISYNKKFCILGNINAVTYKEVFPLLKNGKIWYGKSLFNNKCSFIIPTSNGENKTANITLKNVIWFTNMDNGENENSLSLNKQYNDNEYDKYDNYHAINVDKLTDIPFDYNGVIGVPITILKYLNKNGIINIKINNDTILKYKVLNLDRYIEDNPNYGKRFKINNKEKYARVLIQKVG